MQGAHHEVKIEVPHFIGSDDPRLHHVRSQLDRRHPPVLRQLSWRSKPAELLNRSKNGSKPYPGSVPVRECLYTPAFTLPRTLPMGQEEPWRKRIPAHQNLCSGASAIAPLPLLPRVSGDAVLQ
jgi:hypothetical protein